MKQTVHLLLSLSLLSGSCSEEVCPVHPSGELTPVVFTPQLAVIAEQSRALKTEWAQGEQIAIFSDKAVLQNGSTATSTIVYTRGAATGAWTPPSNAEQWYFANASDKHSFFAYWPLGQITATDYTTVGLPNIWGQDGTKSLDELKEEDDFMISDVTTATRQTTAIPMQMKRAFAIINLKVTLKADAFGGNTATLSSVVFTSTASNELVNGSDSDQATVNLATGTVTCPGGLTTLTLAPAAGFTLSSGSARSIPVKIFPQTGLIKIQFTVDGKTSAALSLSNDSFSAGYIYTYMVTLDAELQKLGFSDPAILDWADAPGNALNPLIPIS